jgi:hypothetical protein
MVFITRDHRQVIEQTSYPTAETPDRDTLGKKTILLQPAFLAACRSANVEAPACRRFR